MCFSQNPNELCTAVIPILTMRTLTQVEESDLPKVTYIGRVEDNIQTQAGGLQRHY